MDTSPHTFIAAVAAEWPVESLMGMEFYSWKIDDDRVGCVCLEIGDDEDTVNLDLVKVTRRFLGQGYGSKILDRVCALADEHFVALEIGIQPDGTTKMGVDELIAFYERRGFEVVERIKTFQSTEGPTMSRSPRPVLTPSVTD